MTKPGTTVARGYGATHTQLRKQWAPKVARGVVPCARCHYVILKGALWDLDHDGTRTGYLGPSHRSCNRAAGGRQAAINKRMRRMIARRW